VNLELITANNKLRRKKAPIKNNGKKYTNMNCVNTSSIIAIISDQPDIVSP
jgi:hypothetical protein